MRPYKGHLFNTYYRKHRGVLVESYDKARFIIDRQAFPHPDAHVLIPVQCSSARKERLLYHLPKNADRIIELKDETFTAELGSLYAQTWIQYTAGAASTRWREPCYYYLQLDEGTNEREIDNILRREERIASLLKWVAQLTRTNNDCTLHGRFTVGNAFYERAVNTLWLLAGKFNFTGPVEYDIASTLQNIVERVVQCRLRGTPIGTLTEFFSVLLCVIKREYDFSRLALFAYLVYFYVGHLNFYQAFRRRERLRALTETEILSAIKAYWDTVHSLLPKGT